MATLQDLFKNPTAAELELTDRYARLPFSGQRERNFEAFALAGMPSRRTETWKYSDLRNALLKLPSDLTSDLPKTPFSRVADAVTIRFLENGVEFPSHIPDGMKITGRAEPLALSGAEDTPIAALGAALATNPHMVVIDVTGTQSAPLHLVFESRSALQCARVTVLVREGVEITVLESHLAGSGFSTSVLEYSVAETAKLQRVVFQKASGAAVQVFTALVQLSASSQYQQISLGFGAKLCRNETRLFHQGSEAVAKINGAYLLSDGHHYDQTSLVRHSMPSCTTRQVCKGAVLDGGDAVFQGKFYVARKAQHTDAEMAHNALILENGGSVNAKPELEIYADDVECAHGNTVGALDGEALFYMRQRGLTERAARALLTEAFILETMDGVPDPIGDLLAAEARNWLEGSL